MENNLKGHVIICGYGLVGERVAEIMTQNGIQQVVIETDPKRVMLVRNAKLKVVEGDATSPKILKSAGIEHAKAIAVVMDDDAKNLFCIITAKTINPKIIIASRVNDELLKERFVDAGVKFIATPNTSTGDEIMRKISKT